MTPIITIVTAAIIEHRRKILLARRAAHKTQGGCWEFPGGKLEAGETPEQCLARELYEELGLYTNIGALFFSNDFAANGCLFKLLTYKAEYCGGRLRFADHDLVIWTSPHYLPKYLLSPPDIEVAAHLYKDYRPQIS